MSHVTGGAGDTRKMLMISGTHYDATFNGGEAFGKRVEVKNDQWPPYESNV